MRLQSKNDQANKVETLVSAAHYLTQAVHLLVNLEFLSGAVPQDVGRGLDFYREVVRFETALIVEALRVSGGNQVQAAALLKLNNTTLNCKIKKYKINPKNLVYSTGNGNSI